MQVLLIVIKKIWQKFCILLKLLWQWPGYIKELTRVFLLIQVSMHYCYCCLETPHQQSQAPLPGSFTESLAWGNEGSLEMPPPPLPASVSDSASKSSHSTGNFLQLTKHYVYYWRI